MARNNAPKPRPAARARTGAGPAPKPAAAAERVEGCCLAGRARLVSRAITGVFDDALRPLELTASQLGLLAVIERHGPVSPAEVGRRLGMDKSTVSRGVDRMRRNGWLCVEADRDARRQALRTTAAGRRLLGRALPRWEAAQAEADAMLGREGVRALHAAARAVAS